MYRIKVRQKLMSNNGNKTQKIGKYTITIDRDLCIGAGSCIAIAPKAYELDQEAKAVFLPTVQEESIETLFDSAKACPVAAIIIHDENGKQVYP